MIPYGRQFIDEDDIAAVVSVLRSDFLTQGPAIAAFEEDFARKVGAQQAIAVNSGTAALHACMAALGIGPGDEVIVPPITFTASANCALFVGATPIFADVTSGGHIDPAQVKLKLSPRTKALIAVDYAGLPCEYDALLPICREAGIPLVCDACHALGATWNGKPAGSIGVLNCFSFHPVKHIATGEGGMVTTDDPVLAQAIRDFRTHGITREASRFQGLGAAVGLAERGPWYYEMQSLGYNYRMSDINAALGSSQLRKLDAFVARRREIAAQYCEGLAGLPHLTLPPSDLHHASRMPYPATHAFHLFPMQIDFEALGKTRSCVMQELRAAGVGTQVHYIPVHLQPYYRARRDVPLQACPQAELFYRRALSLPMYPSMSEADVRCVVDAVRAIT